MSPENFNFSYAVSFISLGSLVALGILIALIVTFWPRKEEDDGVRKQELSHQAYAPVKQEDV